MGRTAGPKNTDAARRPNHVRLADAAQSGVVSVADAGEAFAGEWVLMEVTGYDEHCSPALGRVVAHSNSSRSVCRLMDLALAAPVSPRRRHYLSLAPRRPTIGADLRSVFTALSEEESARDWKPPRPRR